MEKELAACDNDDVKNSWTSVIKEAKTFVEVISYCFLSLLLVSVFYCLFYQCMTVCQPSAKDTWCFISLQSEKVIKLMDGFSATSCLQHRLPEVHL